MTVKIHTVVSWVMTPCSLVDVYHVSEENTVSVFTQKMDTTGFSKTIMLWWEMTLLWVLLGNYMFGTTSQYLQPFTVIWNSSVLCLHRLTGLETVTAPGFASTVIPGFEPHEDPWPNLCSSQDRLDLWNVKCMYVCMYVCMFMCFEKGPLLWQEEGSDYYWSRLLYRRVTLLALTLTYSVTLSHSNDPSLVTDSLTDCLTAKLLQVSPAQWFLVLSPTGPMIILYCLACSLMCPSGRMSVLQWLQWLPNCCWEYIFIMMFPSHGHLCNISVVSTFQIYRF
jgi:hypothetical protein